MIWKKHFPKLLFIGLIFLIGLVILTVVFFQRAVYPSSQMRVSSDSQALKISFDILESDRSRFENFANQLGASELFTQPISLNLDEDSLRKIAGVLPIVINLTIENNKLKLASNPKIILYSALSGQSLSYASYSASLNLNFHSEHDFKLNLKDPAVILREATRSGELKLSHKLDQLFPILTRIDTIELTVLDHTLDGEVNLK